MPNTNIPKFKCQQCGKCCSRIRGRLAEEEKKFIEEFAYGKLPLVQLLPVEKMSFPLFDFEAKRFRKWQKEVNIDAKITPSRVLFDLNTNKSIVFTYYMDYDSCPFLKDNKCLIYNKKRAFVCRVFPFNKGPFLKTEEEFKKLPNESEEGLEKSETFLKEDMFGKCPAITEIIPKLDDKNRKKIVSQLNESFGDSFLNIIEYDYLTEWINKLITKLIKEKRVRPAMNYPYKFLIKRIANSEKIDITDFLIKEKIKTKEEIENLIKEFDNNIDAKEKIKEFLG
ncbi:MAG: YkgJ family cysteine cluster protein [Nanoarchaeota archaeon]|nr:YkgJ family cysteine cluster protein [Nanoarchaeota archaeon]MBU1005352.1 YkgJ family cysteine cluster protein [Nanoarchaeota archaeon]MBU1946092.1 YkgJ family cysteine cluster protein [Nanoarchaeota archaeon]